MANEEDDEAAACCCFCESLNDVDTDDDGLPDELRFSLSLVLGENSLIKSGHMRSLRIKHISGFLKQQKKDKTLRKKLIKVIL